MHPAGFSIRPAVFLAALMFFCPFPGSTAQERPGAAVAPAAAAYGDSSSELERLTKEILRAAKDPNSGAYSALISSLAQTVPESWFTEVFGENAAGMYAQYPVRAQMENELRSFLANVIEKKATNPTGHKHLANCDDESGELIYPVLALREKRVPLYEIRFHHGKKFYRLWALAYVEGSFRFLGNLKPPAHFAPVPVERAAAEGAAVGASRAAEKRIRVGGSVMAAQILHRVKPEYPEIARLEHVQGTVKLHAVIAKDGSIRNLQVLSGYCSLADSAVKAVRQWSYRPVLLNGEPVEVDTTIEVTYSLNTRGTSP